MIVGKILSSGCLLAILNYYPSNMYICMQTVVCGSPLFIGTTFIFVEIKAFKLLRCLFARERKAEWVVFEVSRFGNRL